MILLLPYRKYRTRKGFFRPTLYHSYANAVERNMIHDCHHEYSSPHSPSGGWPDAGRPRNAKALWLVRWPWSHQVDAGVRETRLKTGMAVDQLCDPGSGGRRPLCRIGVLDTLGRRRDVRRH